MFKRLICNNNIIKNKLIKKMLTSCKVNNLIKKMSKLNSVEFKNNSDYYNDLNRNLDNLLYKYIEYDITLDENDYKFLSTEHINKEFILSRVKTLKHNKLILKELLEYPYIEQCTKEWYDIRKTCLTASDLGEAYIKK